MYKVENLHNLSILVWNVLKDAPSRLQTRFKKNLVLCMEYRPSDLSKNIIPDWFGGLIAIIWLKFQNELILFILSLTAATMYSTKSWIIHSIYWCLQILYKFGWNCKYEIFFQIEFQFGQLCKSGLKYIWSCYLIIRYYNLYIVQCTMVRTLDLQSWGGEQTASDEPQSDRIQIVLSVTLNHELVGLDMTAWPWVADSYLWRTILLATYRVYLVVASFKFMPSSRLCSSKFLCAELPFGSNPHTSGETTPTYHTTWLTW